MTLKEALSRKQLGPRLIFTTDWHARARNPRSRTDNYRAALLAKLSYCIEAGNKLGAAKVMLCGGDLFDVPLPGLEVADEIIDLFLSNKWSIASVLGNHDLAGGISSATRTMLGHLMRRGFIKILPILVDAPHIVEGVQLWGHHYTYGNHNDELLVHGDLSLPSAIISHSMIIEKDAPFDGYALYSNVKTNADLLLLGHYHPGSKVVTLPNAAGTIIVAPGALMRGSLARDDITRKPAFALIEVVSRTNILVDYIYIDAKDSKSIFDIDSYTALKAQSSQLSAFASSLDQLAVQSLDAASIIEKISKETKTPDDVRVEALRRLGAI